MSLYEYNARVLRVVDGDTVQLDVDLGFDIRQRMTVRLYGINAPEMSTPGGKPARDHLVGMLPTGATVRLETLKDRKEKYGRYLARIYAESPADMLDVNAKMIEDGHAVPYML